MPPIPAKRTLLNSLLGSKAWADSELFAKATPSQVLKAISVGPPRDLYTKFLHTSEPARRGA